MNNTKIAVIFSNKKNNLHYINNNIALIEAFSKIPSNYKVEYFCHTQMLGAIHKGEQLIWFKNTIKSFKWGINQYFEPDVVFCVGSPNFEWEKIMIGDYVKVFIYDSYDKPKKTLSWDAVIVPTKKDLEYFPKAIVASVYNSNVFKPENNRKHFNKFYPQLVKNMDLFLQIQNDSQTVAMNNTSDVFYLSDLSTHMMNNLFNQSQLSLLLERENDVELALSSMACNVPVITMSDNKSSSLPGVYTSLATTPDLTNIIEELDGVKHEFDVSNHTIDKFLKKIKPFL